MCGHVSPDGDGVGTARLRDQSVARCHSGRARAGSVSSFAFGKETRMAKETSSTIRILFQPLIVGSILAAMLFAETADVTVSRSSLVFAEANSDDFDTVSGKLDQVNV